MRHGTIRRSAAVAAALVGGCLIMATGGCKGAQEFRAAAGDSLKSGVVSITNGLIDGLFAVWEPDASTSTTAQ